MMKEIVNWEKGYGEIGIKIEEKEREGKKYKEWIDKYEGYEYKEMWRKVGRILDKEERERIGEDLEKRKRWKKIWKIFEKERRIEEDLW